MEKDINFLKENLIAHRGKHDIKKGIPENSVLAFEEAIKYKYIIELDIHILKDNSVIVFHDDNIKRMTGIDKNLKNYTYNEIKNLKLQNTNNYIPLFKDVLKIIDNKVPVIIEFKYDTKIGRLEKEAMKILENYKGRYVIKSFNPFTVLWFKKHYPNVIRGQLSCNFNKSKFNFIKKYVLKNMIFNFITKPDFISYDVNSLPYKKVEEFRKKKLVLGWTIRNKVQLEKAKKYCDNFICENFDEL